MQLREETITWDVDFSSVFYLMAEKTSVEGQEELLLFDFEDLINGLGGALGLFLGWSILSLGKIIKQFLILTKTKSFSAVFLFFFLLNPTFLS